MGAGGDDVNWSFDALSAALFLAFMALVARALAAMMRAWQAGLPISYGGLGWFGPSPRVPEEARPHMREAMRRWSYAVLFLLLFGLAAIFTPAPQ